MSGRVRHSGGMKNSQTKTDALGQTELVQGYGDEIKARALLDAWRWPRGPVCPHCQNAGEKTIS